ncbi:hypothetical protein AKJ36_01575 [candidate division MSBL1 archaeon SCGC-AAA259I07]|uniref:Uncharacterized protein n=1 Tax=candidate division MSBL1 archaeon SCGC-AAA259I07 TaxID=1698266 RepID=A0A133ULR4_9EURY|nr:hypothetical protein AKJ36_01575 [candidate division MSBL1 archaeon SCGC-AAA259I07]
MKRYREIIPGFDKFLEAVVGDRPFEIRSNTLKSSPEEVEKFLVSKFLERGGLKKVDFSFPHSRGITRWEGRKLDNELEKCLRIYPHQLNSGGMFVAKFEK